MNKEIKITLTDLYIGYVCAAVLLYVVGGVSYTVGKTKGKLEVADRLNDFVRPENTNSRKLQSV